MENNFRRENSEIFPRTRFQTKFSEQIQKWIAILGLIANPNDFWRPGLIGAATFGGWYDQRINRLRR